MELILGTVLGAAICGALVVIFREALLKRYQHSLDTKLTKVQSTIDTAISDVNVSGSMLANIRTIRKPYEIEALKAMWTEIAELHAMFEDAPAYEDSHTPEQLDRIFQSQGKGSLEDQVVFDALHSCSEGFAEALEEKALKLEDSQHRPFVDVELWGWWALIRKMYFRIGSLLLSSIPQGHYPRWQADPLLQDFLSTLLVLTAGSEGKKLKTRKSRMMVCGTYSFCCDIVLLIKPKKQYWVMEN